MSLQFLVVAILFQPGAVRCAIKTWAANTNFDNANNWDLKRIPCEQDRAIFPADDNVSVFMPKSAVIKELILPNNGLLIFPTDGSFVIGGDISARSCPGQDIKFVGGQRKDQWYDPYNWNITTDRAVNLGENKDLLPIPHSDQVPCEADDVVFPTEASFKLHFDSTSLKVGSLSINGMVYSTENFRSLISSDVGKTLFVNPPVLEIRQQTCSTASGCACGNDQPQILSKICSIVHPKCPKLQCSDPIRVTGHCCPMCGSVLLLEYKEGFSLSVFTRLYTSYLQKFVYRSVQGYASKTRDDKIQLIFTDSGREKGLAHSLARDIQTYLTQDIEDQQIYSLKSIQLLGSVNWLASSDVVTHAPFESPSGSSSGRSAAIVIGVLISIALIAAALYYLYRKRRIPGFRFARFDTEGSKIEMELGTTPHDVLDPVASSSSAETKERGFDNPMYEKSALSLTNPSYKILKEKEKKSIDYRENPTFSVLDDTDE